ncbi:integrase [Neorhizobium lilium]|uniref:Integrase n=1 Tax=Neorhizobium lilium TaxID=2503024 RepID=A0A444LC83_9HYPH|nr:integrase [Neorhizobium lilium]
MLSTLIPVLVTGIQQRRVCDAKESYQPKDLGWLDSCDEHRNEGVIQYLRLPLA